MPLRSELLTKRWAAVDLPILPFLAPRVFTPWPRRGCRAQSSTSATRGLGADGLGDVSLEVELLKEHETSHREKCCRKLGLDLVILNLQDHQDLASSQQDVNSERGRLGESAAKINICCGEKGSSTFDSTAKLHESNIAATPRLRADGHENWKLKGGLKNRKVAPTRDTPFSIARSRLEISKGGDSSRKPQRVIFRQDKIVLGKAVVKESSFSTYEPLAKDVVLSGNSRPKRLSTTRPMISEVIAMEAKIRSPWSQTKPIYKLSLMSSKTRTRAKKPSLGRHSPIPRLPPFPQRQSKISNANRPQNCDGTFKGTRRFTASKARSSSAKSSRFTVSNVIARYLRARKLEGNSFIRRVLYPIRRVCVREDVKDNHRPRFYTPPKELLYWRRKGTRGTPTPVLLWWRSLPTILKEIENLPLSHSDMASSYGYRGSRPLFAQLQNVIDHIVGFYLKPRSGDCSTSLKSRDVHDEKLALRQAPTGSQIESMDEARMLPISHSDAYDSDLDIKRRREAASIMIKPILYILRWLSRSPSSPQKSFLSQISIYQLVQNLDINDLKHFRQTLVKLDCSVQVVSWSYLADRFARAGETHLAIDVVKAIYKLGGDINLDGINKVCSNILQLRYRSDTLISDTEVLKCLLEYGLKPTTVHYNILLHNSVVSGDHPSGWHIFEMMLQNNVEVDSYTYSMLLNIAKKRMDVTSIQRVMQLMSDDETLRNDHIATDHIDIVFRLYKQNQRRRDRGSPHDSITAFELALPIYSQYFSLDPLLQAIPSSKEAVQRLKTDDYMAKSTRPPAPTMAIMFAARLHDIEDPAHLLPLYQNFRTVSLSDDPDSSDVGQCLDDKRIYHSFLMAFGRFPSTLHLCPAVIEDMIKTPAVQRTSETEIGTYHQLVDPVIPYRPTPDIYTWTILLMIYVKNRQPHAAEKVLDLMIARGIEPNQLTYMQLVYGYSNMQDVMKTVSAIERLRRAPRVDLHPDPVSHSVSKLHNRRRFVEVMKELEPKQAVRTTDSSTTRISSDAEASDISQHIYAPKPLDTRAPIMEMDWDLKTRVVPGETHSDSLVVVRPLSIEAGHEISPKGGSIGEELDTFHSLLAEEKKRDEAWDPKPTQLKQDWAMDYYT